MPRRPGSWRYAGRSWRLRSDETTRITRAGAGFCLSTTGWNRACETLEGAKALGEIASASWRNRSRPNALTPQRPEASA